VPVPAEKSKVIRFGVFEVSPQEAELRKHGLRIKLQDQPFQILLMLVEHPGQIVTRDDLRQKLWPADIFVDFDHSLNSSIKKLRQALGDDSENPRFIETLHRRGYRFIAPVDLPDVSAVVGSEPCQSIAPVATNAAPDLRSTGQHAQTSTSFMFEVASQHKFTVVLGVCAVLIVVSAAGFGVYSLLRRPAPMPFQKFTITQITNTGKAILAAVSPDGRYVLSAMNDNGRESIWLRNVPTGSDTQVIPPSPLRYESLTFSPDGNYFYFLTHEAGSPLSRYLYRSAILGGTAQVIVRNSAGDITFSPDGRRIFYLRGANPDATHWRMFTASLDGDNETLLHTGQSPDWPASWAWSPRGDEIFYSLGSAIRVLDAHSGYSHPFVSFKDKLVAAIRWSPDAHGLLANYRGTSAKSSSGQIGFVRARGGDIEPITRDANTYDTLSLSEDGRTLATIQRRSYGTIYVLSKIHRQFGEPRSILSQVSQFDEGSGLSWTSEGLLLTDTVHLWKLGSDGKNKIQLLAHSGAEILDASPCGANFLVLSWARHGGHASIWRTNADGSSPLRLTDADNWWHRLPVCSPDQKWVYYVDWSQNISRVLLDGSGKPEVILRLPSNYNLDIDATTGGLSVSPDGTALAAAVFDASQRRLKIAVFKPGTSSLPRMLDAVSFSGQGLQFTADGKTIAYITREKGVDNVWAQPLDGSAGYPITDFKSERIWSFSMSSDTKSLAVLRGHYDSDVVLLQETKP
jgi:DNA-binding winged helix-turn-helix (wHTH) protein/Tol biopolymer transport system component